MSVIRFFHDYSSSPLMKRKYDRSHARMFHSRNEDMFVSFLSDFKKLYYEISDQAGFDRGLLLRNGPLSSNVFRSQSLIPYIAECMGEYDLLDDVLSDMKALEPAKWYWALGPSPARDLHNFYFQGERGDKFIQRHLRAMIDDRIEMFCNEAAEQLSALPFKHQHFLMTRKNWKAKSGQAKPTFLAAAGNLAAALPMNQAEDDFAHHVAGRFCRHIAQYPDMMGDYGAFLLARAHDRAEDEVNERVFFMQRHFNILANALNVNHIQGVATRHLPGEAQYSNGVVTYAHAEGRGINRASRADVFNIGNHEFVHHLLKTPFLARHASQPMRSRVAFNHSIYMEAETHFGAYQNQYAERLCDTVAAVLFEKLCASLRIHPYSVIRFADYKIVNEGACKRLFLPEEVADLGERMPYRTVRTPTHDDNPSSEQWFALKI